MPTTYAIPDGRTVMAATTYTGNGNTTQSISNAVNGVSFQPDFVWNKTRSNADDHRLVDIVRGGGTDLSSSILYSNLTNAQDNSSGYITQTSSGFNLGVAATPLNMSGRTYVAWQWKAGGTAVSNTAGSITSSVSANTTAGFSVVTYTGNSTNNATVGHGLGVVPSMIILKNRSGAYDWPCYHISLGSGKYIYLNQGATAATDANMWKTTPTSTVFTLGTYTENNGSANNYVAYCFAAVAGYSAFGSFSGNGTTDNTFIYTGFKPRFVLIKRTDGASNWFLLDSSRSSYNVSNALLRPNLADAEVTATSMDFVSNGIKLRDAGFGSGETYIYACFAENPFKYANAR
jgi:hypothetical protein